MLSGPQTRRILSSGGSASHARGWTGRRREGAGCRDDHAGWSVARISHSFHPEFETGVVQSPSHMSDIRALNFRTRTRPLRALRRRADGPGPLTWGGSLCFPTSSSISTLRENSGEIHASSAIECKKVQRVNAVREKPKARQDLALRRVTPSLCRAVIQVRESLAGTGRRKAKFFDSCYQKISFCARGLKAHGWTEAVLPFALADGGRLRIWGWSASRAAPWRFWIKATCSRASFWLRVWAVARHRERASAFP